VSDNSVSAGNISGNIKMNIGEIGGWLLTIVREHYRLYFFKVNPIDANV